MSELLCEARKEWLELRKRGIGGSDAACVIGISPNKSNVQLWREKTGRVQPEDISGLPYVQYGVKAEEHLRALFALDYPQYKVDFYPFKIIKNRDCPFVFCTLDGELTDESGRRGVLEIKTTEAMKSATWDEWNDRIPQHYYAQICHQLLATGFEFAVLKAQIKHSKGITTRHYFYERSETQQDMDFLLKAEAKFWEYVRTDREPPRIIPDF